MPQTMLVKEKTHIGYNLMGHRIAKHVKTAANVLESSTYYVLDAQGNTMSVYEHVVNSQNQNVSYKQTEKHIYGSSRLGVNTTQIPLLGTQNQTYSMKSVKHSIGQKLYELSNHLGNVLSTISDKPIPQQQGGVVAYFMPDIREAKDYSGFGVVLHNRDYKLTGTKEYRYSFQSQEVDGESGLVNFEYRMHNPNLGRFFAIDPLAPKYPDYSPYMFSGNIVINAVELEGLEPGVLFNTIEEAAANFALFYNDNSIRDNQEYGSTIYKTVDANNVVKYAYSSANIGVTGASVSCSPSPSGTTPVADIHSHAAYSFGAYKDNVFSGDPSAKSSENKKSTSGDLGDNNRTGLVGFVVTPNGSLQKYDPSTGKITDVNSKNPSDPNDPSRKNRKPSEYENFIELDQIVFNSDLARKSTKNEGVLIVKDIKTGKDFGVIRNENGSYNFFNGSNNKKDNSKGH